MRNYGRKERSQAAGYALTSESSRCSPSRSSLGRRAASTSQTWSNAIAETVISRCSQSHNCAGESPHSRPIRQIKLMNPSRISPRASILLVPAHSLCTAALEASIPSPLHQGTRIWSQVCPALLQSPMTVVSFRSTIPHYPLFRPPYHSLRSFDLSRATCFFSTGLLSLHRKSHSLLSLTTRRPFIRYSSPTLSGCIVSGYARFACPLRTHHYLVFG